MEVIFHSHSFVEINLGNESILIDPFITWNAWCDISLEEVASKNISAIIITHGHEDHIWDTVDIVHKTWAKVISTYEVIQYLVKKYDIISTHSMHIWWSFDFDLFSIKFVNAVHGGWIWEDISWWKAAWVIIKVNGKKIYHAWDTALTYDMKLLEKENIDLAFLPIWDNFTMWIEDALKAVEFIKPKKVVPIHYDTFDVIKAEPTKFASEVMLANISTCKVLSPWQAIVYNETYK